MYLGSKYSFRLVSKKKIKQQKSCEVSVQSSSEDRRKLFQDIIPPTKVVKPETRDEVQEIDEGKRSFLKLASMAGLGAVALSVIPQKAEAYVMGSTPASNVVGVKNTSNVKINPATEETLLTMVSGQGVSKKTVTLTGSGIIHTPATGKKLRVYANRFSLSADMSNVSFRFGAGGTDFEKYISPKTGGLYGANNHPNFVEGNIDEVVYCIINGTGSVQINLDYKEV